MSVKLPSKPRYLAVIASLTVPDVTPEMTSLFKPGPGKLIATACSKRAQDGPIIVSERLAKAHRPDVCRVISAGEGVPLSPGDIVMTVFEQGMRISGFGVGKLNIPEHLMLFGVNGDANSAVESTTIYAPHEVAWDKYSLMIYEDNQWNPLGQNVLLEMPVKEEKVGSLYMPDNYDKPQIYAMVKAIGKDVARKGYDFTPGSLVLYNEKVAHEFYGEDGKRYRIVSANHIYGTVTPDD